MISAISAFKAVAFPMPYKYDTVSQPVRACTMCTAGKYLAMLFLLQCYLANVYDCSPRTWTLHADIHSHIFFEVEINQQDKYIRIVAGHQGVPDVIIDGFAMLWTVHWPANGAVEDDLIHFLGTIKHHLER